MHAAAGHSRGRPPAVVVIDAAVVQNMGVRTDKVPQVPGVQSVRTAGTLDAPETCLHDISLNVGGRMEKLYANQEGQHVHIGEPRFDLYSPDLIAGGGELVGAGRGARADCGRFGANVCRQPSSLATGRRLVWPVGPSYTGRFASWTSEITPAEVSVAKSEPIELEAVVTLALPNAMFKLRLDNSDREILGIVSGKMRKHFIRILPGDRVKVELSPYDLTKGRIVFRQK